MVVCRGSVGCTVFGLRLQSARANSPGQIPDQVRFRWIRAKCWSVAAAGMKPWGETWPFTVTRVFEVAHFRRETLAEGHIHRSLGQRPRKTSEPPLFGRRPYSPPCFGQGEYGLRPKIAQRHRGPGALPQATMRAGLRPSTDGLPNAQLRRLASGAHPGVRSPPSGSSRATSLGDDTSPMTPRPRCFPRPSRLCSVV